MSWKNDMIILGGIAIAGLAVVTYLNPKRTGEVVVETITPIVQAFNPANPHAVQNEPMFQAGKALGQWQKANINDPLYQTGYALGQWQQANINVPVMNAWNWAIGGFK